MSTVVVGTLKSNSTSPPAFQNTNGTEIGQLCRAWVNFNGTGTVAIRAQFNVSSITDNGTGNYTVNFASAMTDANYAFATMAGNGANWYWSTGPVGVPTASAFQFGTGTGSAADMSYVSCSIFR